MFVILYKYTTRDEDLFMFNKQERFTESEQAEKTCVSMSILVVLAYGR